MAKRSYNSTVARVAGNIAAGLVTLKRADGAWPVEQVAETAVKVARAIVAEVERTESETQGAGHWTIEDDITTDTREKDPA